MYVLVSGPRLEVHRRPDVQEVVWVQRHDAAGRRRRRAQRILRSSAIARCSRSPTRHRMAASTSSPCSTPASRLPLPASSRRAPALASRRACADSLRRLLVGIVSAARAASQHAGDLPERSQIPRLNQTGEVGANRRDWPEVGLPKITTAGRRGDRPISATHALRGAWSSCPEAKVTPPRYLVIQRRRSGGSSTSLATTPKRGRPQRRSCAAAAPCGCAVPIGGSGQRRGLLECRRRLPGTSPSQIARHGPGARWPRVGSPPRTRETNWRQTG